LAVSAKDDLHVFCVDVENYTANLTAKSEVQMDCMCSAGEGKLYIANKNKIALAYVTNGQMSFGKTKAFSDDAKISVSTIKYTYLEDGDDTEEFLAIATTNFSLILMKDLKPVTTILNATSALITQILCLTDYYFTLTFVTLSLDGQIRLFNEVGNLISQA